MDIITLAIMISLASSATAKCCPSCGSDHIVNNGKFHNGKHNFKCRNCNRQFVEDPKQRIISQETKEMVDKLLKEKIPLRG